MKRNLIRIGAGLLAAAFLAVGAAAAETALPADAKLAEPIPVIPEGMLRLPVTSSLAEDKSDLSVLFDGKADTGLTPTFAEGEEAVFSFRTATGIAKILSGFAVITEGGENRGLQRLLGRGTGRGLEGCREIRVLPLRILRRGRDFLHDLGASPDPPRYRRTGSLLRPGGRGEVRRDASRALRPRG